MKYKVAVTDTRRPSYQIEQEVLARCGATLTLLDCSSEDELIDACADFDGLLVDMAPVTGKVVRSLKRCKAISRYGVGYDNVDVQACTEAGIVVANVPDYCFDDVSELALGLMMCGVRQIAQRDRRIRGGEWNIALDGIHRLNTRTLALLGFGQIARALAKKAGQLGFAEIIAYDPYCDEAVMAEYGVRKVEWEEALALADIISLHMPLLKATEGIISAKAIEMMKPTAGIVNTSRGKLIDESALGKALQDGKCGWAALDVFVNEPLDENSVLRGLQNCVLTDHSAYNTEEALQELCAKVAQNVRDVLEGRMAPYAVNLKEG